MTRRSWVRTRPGRGAPGARPLAMLVTAGGALAMPAVALLTWAHSGLARRNSFELAQVSDRLGAIDGTVERMVLFAWFAVPALAAATWLAATFRRPVLVAGLGGTVALIGVTAAAIVLVSPLRAGAGPWVALGVGATTLAGALATVWPRGRLPE